MLFLAFSPFLAITLTSDDICFFHFLALERPLNNMYAIYAGLEPESFIELFPYWVVQDDITDLQIDVSFVLLWGCFFKFLCIQKTCLDQTT